MVHLSCHCYDGGIPPQYMLALPLVWAYLLSTVIELGTFMVSPVMQVLQEGAAPSQQLLVPLAVAMSQQLEYTLYALPTKHIKEVAELHDRVNDITQQVCRDVLVVGPLNSAILSGACRVAASCGSAAGTRMLTAAASLAALKHIRQHMTLEV